MKKRIKITRSALGNVRKFVEDNAAILTAPATAIAAQVINTINEIDLHGGNQVFGRGIFRAGVDERQTIARELRSVLREIADTAKVLNKSTHPGIAEQFRMPPNNYQSLLDSGRAFVQAVTPIKAAYVARGFEADFVEKTTEIVDAFDVATQRKFGGLQEQVEGSIALKEAARRGMSLIRDLDAILSRQLRRTDLTLFQAWKSAKKLKGVHHTQEEEGPQTSAAVTAPSQP